jgi:hypothetical protein
MSSNNSNKRKKLANLHRRRQQGRNRNRKGYVRRKMNQPQRGGPYNITEIKNVPIQTRVMRYQSPSTATQFTFRTTDLLLMIMFSDTTTSAYSLMSAVKLKRIKLSLMPDQTDLSGACVLTWLGQFAPNSEFTMLYMAGVPMTENFYPPDSSVVSWWITDTTDAQDIFDITLSTAIPFILDIEFEWTLPGDNTATSTLVISGGTAGRIVYPALPRSTGAGRLIPIGLPSVS